VECLRQILDLVFGASGEFFAALVGAGFGAYAAYFFQQEHERKKERESRISALRMAQGAIGSQWEAMANIRKLCDENGFRKPGIVNLRRVVQAYSFVEVDMVSLSFLFEGEHAHVVFEIQRAQGAVKTVMQGVKIREDLVVKLTGELQATHIDAEQNTGKATGGNPMEILNLSDLTKSLCKSVDDACSQAEAGFSKLRSTGKQLFPGENFLEMRVDGVATKKS
jgi:hypothetical protein